MQYQPSTFNVLATERNAAPKIMPATREDIEIKRILFIISVSVSPVGVKIREQRGDKLLDSKQVRSP
ncbi:hypothetical protein BH18THE1_BH18THE1_16900 [soil metagenome]